MALIRTILSAAISASDLMIPVASTAAFPMVGTVLSGTVWPVQIDDEMTFLVQVAAPNLLKVRSRGSDGQVAAAHDIGSAVVSAPTINDFPILTPASSNLRPPFSPDLVTYGQDGAIAVPVEPWTIAKITKSTAGVFTLAAPSLALDGIRIYIQSQTAAPHIISGPGLFIYGGTAGSPFSTLTFTAQVGAGVTLTAMGGSWVLDTPFGLITVS